MKRRVQVVVAVVAVLVGASLVSAASVGAYGKANWQTTLHGTFNFPTTGNSFGFWGWCDFAGGVTSGNDADCQLEEYVHAPAGSGWNCHLDIDGTSWDQSIQNFPFPTFHMSGSLVVRGNLTPDEQDVCVGFFVFGAPIPYSSRTFSNVDTFIPAAPGHYNFFAGFIPGAVGSFGFQVNQIQ